MKQDHCIFCPYLALDLIREMHDLIQIRQDHSKIMPRYVSKSWQDLGMICNKILAWSLAKILLRSSDRAPTHNNQCVLCARSFPVCLLLHTLLAYGTYVLRVTKWHPMRNQYFRVSRNTAEHVPFNQNRNSRCNTPEDFLTCRAGIILIASGDKSANLAKERTKSCYGCHFATLALLAYNFGHLIGQGST